MKQKLNGKKQAEDRGAGRALLNVLAAGIFALIVILPFHALLTTWLGAAFGEPLLWKSWKEMLLIVMVVACLIYSSLRPVLARRVIASPLTIAILAYVALHFLLAAIYHQPFEATLAGLMTNLRFFAIFLVAQVLLMASPHRAGHLRHVLTKVLLVLTVVVSVFGLLQVTVLPKEFLTSFGYSKELSIAPYILIDEQDGALRAFSTLRGPNTLGMFLLLPIAILAVYIYRRRLLKRTVPAFVLAMAALFATGSRSAWIGLFVTLSLVGLLLFGRKRILDLVRRWGIATLVLATLAVVTAFQYPPLRLVIFHSNPDDTHLTEGSTDKHFLATLENTRDALAHPFGRGPGQAGPASFYSAEPRIAENYYVQITQETGFIGLALFLFVSFLVAKRLWRAAKQPNAPPLIIGLMASFWGIAVINMLLHGWADDPASLIWWGLAGLSVMFIDIRSDSSIAISRR